MTASVVDRDSLLAMNTMEPRPSATVFSWYMPEVETLIADFARDDYPTHRFKSNYFPGLDAAHEYLMSLHLVDTIGQVFDDPDALKHELPWRYYTNGSSEALYHLLVRHRIHFPRAPLYQFVGEYQGYSEYAKSVGIFFHDVEFGQDILKLPSGVFFISVPSSVDGNNVDLSVIERICKKHYVIIDCAYAGMSRFLDKLRFNDRIAAVVGSMSKPFGLYYHRIGFVWAKDPITSLYGNKWFKNLFSIAVGEEVYRNYSPLTLADKYRSWQERACQDASATLGVEVKPSDVWLLGHVFPSTETVIPSVLNEFKRGPGYRLCLTPYYMEYARNG